MATKKKKTESDVSKEVVAETQPEQSEAVLTDKQPEQSEAQTPVQMASNEISTLAEPLPRVKRAYRRKPPRSEAPECFDGEMLVRDAESRIVDCDRFETRTFIGPDNFVYVRGHKNQWKEVFKSRHPNEKIQATFSEGVLRIG